MATLPPRQSSWLSPPSVMDYFPTGNGPATPSLHSKPKCGDTLPRPNTVDDDTEEDDNSKEEEGNASSEKKEACEVSFDREVWQVDRRRCSDISMGSAAGALRRRPTTSMLRTTPAYSNSSRRSLSTTLRNVSEESKEETFDRAAWQASHKRNQNRNSMRSVTTIQTNYSSISQRSMRMDRDVGSLMELRRELSMKYLVPKEEPPAQPEAVEDEEVDAFERTVRVLLPLPTKYYWEMGLNEDEMKAVPTSTVLWHTTVASVSYAGSVVNDYVAMPIVGLFGLQKVSEYYADVKDDVSDPRIAPIPEENNSNHKD